MIEFDGTSTDANDSPDFISNQLKKLTKAFSEDLATSLNFLMIFVITIYKINFSSNQDIYLIKHRFLLEEEISTLRL